MRLRFVVESLGAVIGLCAGLSGCASADRVRVRLVVSEALGCPPDAVSSEQVSSDDGSRYHFREWLAACDMETVRIGCSTDGGKDYCYLLDRAPPYQKLDRE